MDAAAHRDRARRIRASMVKWDDGADVEAVVEGAMHVSTHLLNAVLHERGLTPPSRDLIHSDMPPPPEPVPDDLGPALVELAWIEGLRAFYVRGSEDAPPGTGERCRGACGLFERIAAGSAGGPA